MGKTVISWDGKIDGEQNSNCITDKAFWEYHIYGASNREMKIERTETKFDVDVPLCNHR